MEPLVKAVPLAEVSHVDRVMVLNLNRVETQQSPYVFEGVALEIWARIDGKRGEQEIVDELVAQTGADLDQVTQETQAFLATLLELGLIQSR